MKKIGLLALELFMFVCYFLPMFEFEEYLQGDTREMVEFNGFEAIFNYRLTDNLEVGVFAVFVILLTTVASICLHLVTLRNEVDVSKVIFVFSCVQLMFSLILIEFFYWSILNYLFLAAIIIHLILSIITVKTRTKYY